MKKIKMFCECCRETVLVDGEEGPCPKCGGRDLWEPEDEDVDPFEFFDGPCSPIDTIGGI